MSFAVPRDIKIKYTTSWINQSIQGKFIHLRIKSYYRAIMVRVSNQPAAVMIFASSASNLYSEYGKQFHKLSSDPPITSQIQKSPLKGINIDVSNILDYYAGRDVRVLKTSKEQTLLKKSFILQKLKEFFLLEKCKVFIYTGHGCKNGNPWIQTYQNPDGQEFTFEEILSIPKSGFKHWFIFDSCYSGKLAFKYHKMEQHTNFIDISCSSGPNHTSLDVYRFGGLLITKIFNSEYLKKEEAKELAQKFEQRNPVQFIEGINALYQSKWKCDKCYTGGRFVHFRHMDCLKKIT